MSGAAGGEPRVSIPNNARKMIQNIKEITGNHSDEEVYAMLRECRMDPNDTVDKLLFQDTFHVVKGKRYKRKENVGSKEVSDAGWRAVGQPGQGRGGRGSRASYSSRFVTNDAGGSKNFPVGKEMGVVDKVFKATAAVQDSENKASHSKLSSASGVANGDVKFSCTEENRSPDTRQPENSVPSTDISTGLVLVDDVHGQPVLSTQYSSTSTAPALEAGVSTSASKMASFNSHDKDTEHAKENIKHDACSQQRDVEPCTTKVSCEVADVELLPSLDETIASHTGASHLEGTFANKVHTLDVNHLPEVSQPASVPPTAVSSESRPSSSSRPQSLVGQQKVSIAPAKEWKPKQQKPDVVKVFHSTGVSEVLTPSAEISNQSLVSVTASVLEDTASKVQKKMGELQFSDRRHVIFPNHIRVPEAERAGLSFGSFDASFAQKSCPETDAEGDNESVVESVEDHEETSKEIPLSNSETASAEVEEEVKSDHPQSMEQIPEGISSEDAVASSSNSAGREFDHLESETVLVSGAPTSEYSVVQTLPTYSTFGLMAPVFAGPVSSIDNNGSQARDASRLPSIVVPQPFDLSSSFYTQLYRANPDSEGRLSPVVAPVSNSKYNGYTAVLPSQVDQTSQESGGSPIQPTSVSASVSNQGAGIMQNSAAVQQHPVSVFRQPTGLHISHYPPNFVPYSQYFSPFYLPPPGIHPFLSNPAFPQQHPVGNLYPPHMAPAAAPIKFSVSQFKSGGNGGNSAHGGSTTGFGLYSSGLTNYNLAPATSIVNSTGNEDIAQPQYKENNMYLTGQQSENPTVWIPAPGREIPGLQASSFYNIAPQGQPVAFTQVQGAHGAFPGIYHPTQTGGATPVHPLLQQSQAVAGAVEMVAPPTGVYQQPQRSQINWANNY